MSAIRLVLTTVGSEADAHSLARTLVDEQLAACVTVQCAARSVYRWQGRIEDTSEWPMTVKTTSSHLQALLERMRDLHPYDLPELVVIDPVEVDAAYSHWIEQSVATTKAG